MGNSCTHAADAVAHLVTEDEIRKAIRSVEEWQRTQATTVKGAGPGQNNHAPLLQRVGGPDVVKKVVELFYKKLYADPRLILFLHDQDVLHLRAKQSAFISWLFGPPNVPYLGRSVRIAHLRIIKQRGFNGDDFDLGMKYFEEAMAELGAAENIVGEVMRRLRPFKDAFFTPSAKDAEEEARWVVEEREKAAAEAEAAQRAQQEEELHQRQRQLQQQMTLAQRAAEAELAAEAEGEGATEWAADAAVMAAVAASLGASRAASRSLSRGASQCPFTGGRLSRPGTISASGAAEAVAEVSPPPRTPPTPPPPAAAAAAAPAGPPVLTAAAASGAASRAASSTRLSGAGVAAAAPPPPLPRSSDVAGVGGAGSASRVSAGISSSRPSSQAASRLGSASGAAPASGSAAAAAEPAPAAADAPAPAGPARMQSPPTAPSPPTPPAATDRPGTANAVSPPVTAPAPPAAAAVAAVPDPLAEFEAEINAIESTFSPDGGNSSSSQTAPLLPPTLESSSSGARRTAAAVC